VPETGNTTYLDKCCYKFIYYNLYTARWEWNYDGDVNITEHLDGSGEAKDSEGNIYFYNADHSGYCFCVETHN